MKVNLSKEVIETVCGALRNDKRHLETMLYISIPNKKASADKKEEFECKLAEVEEALSVFEKLID